MYLLKWVFIPNGDFGFVGLVVLVNGRANGWLVGGLSLRQGILFISLHMNHIVLYLLE